MRPRSKQKARFGGSGPGNTGGGGLGLGGAYAAGGGGAGPVDHGAGGHDAVVESAIAALVLAHQALETVFEQGAELGKLGAEANADGFAVDLGLAGGSFQAVEGSDGVLKFLDAGFVGGIRGGVRFEGGGEDFGGCDAVILFGG